MARVLRDKGGFTLIELLVSLVILMVVMMGILEALCAALQHNMKNQLRNEGVRAVDTAMARELSKGFANVSTQSVAASHLGYVPCKVMGVMRNYSYSQTGDGSMPNSKTVTITAWWRYKGEWFSHTATSAISGTTP